MKRSASTLSTNGHRPSKIMKRSGSLTMKQDHNGSQSVRVAKVNGSTNASTMRYKSGQNTMKSGLCIATHLTGAPCMSSSADKFVPYCQEHKKKGDPSLKVIKHPKFGRTLICARELPPNYYIALFGTTSTYKNIPEIDLEWAFVTSKKIYLNPRSHDSQLMYSQCPGPNEIVTLGFAKMYEMVSKKEPMGSMLFVTKMPMPKDYQLVMMYNDSEKTTEEFFSDRGITRCDVGTPQNPCFRKNKLKRVSPELVKELGMEAVAARVTKLSTGQHAVKSGLCIATFLDGKPCTKVAYARFVPYCSEHMRNGDPSLKVVKNKKYGRQLVAARALPPNYVMALFGDLVPEKDMDEENKNWGFQTSEGNYIDPAKYNALIKYCQCPGPNEVVTVCFARESENVGPQDSMGSMIFITKREIPKDHQLVMMYCEDEKTTDLFFKERNIERKDVGSKEFPCFLKTRAQKSR